MIKKRKTEVIVEALILCAVLQVARELLEYLFKFLANDNSFYRRMATMFIMIFLTCCVIAYARFKKMPLSVFPQKFSLLYIICTCLAAVLLICSPSNFSGGYKAILLLIYGSIVTPIYEELIFRGYIWNRLSLAFTKPFWVYVWSVIFFTLWHLGYMTEQILSGNFEAVFFKLLAGLGYGAVLGLIRLKTDNCYIGILAHGVLNLFMI